MSARLDPTTHYLRDASLAVPGIVLAAPVATLLAYWLCVRRCAFAVAALFVLVAGLPWNQRAATRVSQ